VTDFKIPRHHRADQGTGDPDFSGDINLGDRKVKSALLQRQLQRFRFLRWTEESQSSLPQQPTALPNPSLKRLHLQAVEIKHH